MNYNAVQETETKTFYYFKDRNRKGEELVVEICETYPDNKSKYSLPNLWKKHGYTDRTLANYYSVGTYATDPDSVCRGRYNPQRVLGANKINFDWMLEVTEQNRERLLREIYRRFIEAME